MLIPVKEKLQMLGTWSFEKYTRKLADWPSFKMDRLSEKRQVTLFYLFFCSVSTKGKADFLCSVCFAMCFPPPFKLRKRLHWITAILYWSGWQLALLKVLEGLGGSGSISGGHGWVISPPETSPIHVLQGCCLTHWVTPGLWVLQKMPVAAIHCLCKLALLVYGMNVEVVCVYMQTSGNP